MKTVVKMDSNLLSQLLSLQNSNASSNNTENKNMTAVPQILPMNYSSASSRLPLNNFMMVRQESRLNRERFVVFLQILLRRLEVAQAYQLKLQAKVLVMECTRNNKLGDKTPLVSTLEMNLRQLVGEAHWRYAVHATHRYFRQKEHRQQRFPLDIMTTL